MQQQQLDGGGSESRGGGSERAGYPPDLAELRREVFRRDGYRCKLCGQEGGPRADGETIELHAHYTVPPAEGGSSSLDNLLTLCDPCHQRHHAAQTEDPADADRSESGSVAALVVTWGTFCLLSLLSLTTLSGLLGEQLLSINPYLAAAGSVVTLGLAVRLASRAHQTATAATAATVAVWAIVFYGTDALGTVVGTAEPTGTFLLASALAAVPYVLTRHLRFRL